MGREHEIPWRRIDTQRRFAMDLMRQLVLRLRIVRLGAASAVVAALLAASNASSLTPEKMLKLDGPPLLAEAVARLEPPSPYYDDGFAAAVAISGDTAVVGAHADSEHGVDAGAAYIFKRNTGGAYGWGLVRKIVSPETNVNHRFGCAVAIDGDTIAVGAYGAITGQGRVYVFERNQGGEDAWGQVRRLQASDASNRYRFGSVVAMSGDTIIVGSPESTSLGDHAGAAYIFERNRGGADHWGQVARLFGDDTNQNDFFGCSVTISGDAAVVGANGRAGSRGGAYLFERNRGGPDAWGRIAVLDPMSGPTTYWLKGRFGESVAIDRDRIVVGGPDSSTTFGGGTICGAAVLFERNRGGADAWGPATVLLGPGDDSDFGSAVAIDHDVLVVGASYEERPSGRVGATHVYGRNLGGPDAWGEIAILEPVDQDSSSGFGAAVAIEADTIVVGAPRPNDIDYLGVAYVFRRNHGGPDAWSPCCWLRGGDPGLDFFDYFGRSVSISGDFVGVGAPGRDDHHGASYVFYRVGAGS
jgi:hypothetical protein